VPVATESFEATYAGDLVVIGVGEWCTPGHDLVRRYPDSFAPDRRDKLPRERQRLSPSARVYGGLRREPSERYTVELTDGGWLDLDAALGAVDGCEVGGGLYGRVEGRKFVVEAVGDQAPGITRSHTYTEIDPERELEIARSCGLAWLGDWHYHLDSGSPSAQDERAWNGLRGRQDAWLGVIVTDTRDERGWPTSDPVLHCWTVGDDGLRAASLERRTRWLY
jgi:hypothetical protein